MDTYLLIKTLHVLAVVIWVGGDFACLVLSLRHQRSRDVAAFMRLLPDIMFVTKVLAVPSSLTALVCGLAMVLMSWDFGQMWVWIGLAGFALVFVGGVAFLRPRTERLIALADDQGPTPRVAERAAAILRVVAFDHAVMFLVVADMVLKPGFDDYAIWLGMLAILVAAGALIWLVPARREQPA
jgi:uncharacterized membrane protein